MRLKLLFAFLLFSYFGFGQEAPTFKKEFGIDALFINRFLPLDNPIGISSPYLFNYRIHKSEKKFLRMGLDVNLNGRFEDNDISTSTDNFFIDSDFRIGWGKKKSLYPKFMLLYGTDILTGIFIRKNSTEGTTVFGPDQNSSTLFSQLSIGAGPFIGLNYQLSKRFSLYTEASFYLTAFYEKSVFDNSKKKFINEAYGGASRFKTPGNLVLFYRFN